MNTGYNCRVTYFYSHVQYYHIAGCAAVLRSNLDQRERWRQEICIKYMHIAACSGWIGYENLRYEQFCRELFNLTADMLFKYANTLDEGMKILFRMKINAVYSFQSLSGDNWSYASSLDDVQCAEFLRDKLRCIERVEIVSLRWLCNISETIESQYQIF